MERVSFEVGRGTTFAIRGGSGSGKSTLLRCLIGLEEPSDGFIDIDGIGAPHAYEGVPRFGVLTQSGALFSSMTLIENLALPLATWTSVRGTAVRESIQAKLDLVGLGAFAEHRPSEMSGVMKRRAEIARALVLDPELLFLDDPSAGLDPISAAELDQLIVTISRDFGITTVLAAQKFPSTFLAVNTSIMLDPATKGIAA